MILGVLLFTGCSHDRIGPAGEAPTSTAQLLNTYWKLTQLGDRVITTPQDTRELHLVLHSENQRVAGFSGCNGLMGSYVLNGSELTFEQVGGTLMACAGDMEIERQFLAMFGQVSRWEIRGEMLELRDAGGRSLAVFESRYLR
jgi:heat shock protein HslJ